jgi:stage IV sporulation protein FB
MLRILTASFPVGRLWGVPVRIQGLFVAFFALAVSYFLSAHGAEQGAILSLVLTGAFLFVVVHELGHAMAARLLGVRVTDVTIWPLGGMARLEDVPLSGRTEVVIAAAGPLANLASAGLLAGSGELLRTLGLTEIRPVTLLVWINLLLAGFNALPAFPLDGGRVLRCVLASFLGFRRATMAAVWIGRVLALGLGAAAIRGGLHGLALLAVFMLVSGGRDEEIDEEEREELDHAPTVQSCRTGAGRPPPGREEPRHADRPEPRN